jgi:hypothetical protein
MSNEKHSGGRPTLYNQELADEICLKIATSDYGLTRLCAENLHWPARDTIFEWRLKHKEFSDKYARAKQDQIESIVDEIIDIADDNSKDMMMISNNGEERRVVNTEHINRSRLRIDTRKWLASKLAPKIYGEKITQQHDISIKQEDAIRDLG